MIDRVPNDYLADANVAENHFISILYQPSAEDLLDTSFEERIRTYMDNTLPPIIDRMVRHQLASAKTRARPNQ